MASASETEQEMDFSKFKTGPGDNLLAQIAQTARDQLEAERLLAEAEALVETRKEDLRKISEGTLQELMQAAETVELTTRDGIKVKVGEAIRASIAKKDPEKAARAFKWLEENGYDRVIKRQITIQFNKDDNKWADKFERDCAQRKKKLNLKRERTVASATLKKLVGEMLEAGVKFDHKDFGVHRQRFAKIEVVSD